MNIKRLFRDGLILLLFCGAFYATTYVGGETKVVTDEASSTTYTATRVSADELTHLRKWEEAADEFKKMLEADPLNGYAQYRLAASYYNQRITSANKLNDGSKDRLPLTEGEIAALKHQIAKCEELAIENFEKARDFLRYRTKAAYYLAVIYADRGDFENALSRLEEFVGEGGWHNEGLENVSNFGAGERKKMKHPKAWVTPQVRLHQFEQFWELVDKANVTRRAMAEPTQIRPTFGAGN